jgi:hypothetical protein
MRPRTELPDTSQHASPRRGGPEPGERPAFLTVEEAMVVLRLGRTTAYGLAGQWEATHGETGLPVVRFGRLLRVPLLRLEEFAGGPVDLTLLDHDAGSAETPAADPESPVQAITTPERRRRSRPPAGGQSSLFGEAS